MRAANAKLVFLGVGFGYCTFLHHVEQRLGVPYRYHKQFGGTVHAAGAAVTATANYFVRDLEAGDVETYFDPLGQLLTDSGAMTRVTLPGRAGAAGDLRTGGGGRSRSAGRRAPRLPTTPRARGDPVER